MCTLGRFLTAIAGLTSGLDVCGEVRPKEMLKDFILGTLVASMSSHWR